LFKLLVSVSV